MSCRSRDVKIFGQNQIFQEMTPTTFTESASARLETFLNKRFAPQRATIQPLTPDASTREYFRVNWNEQTAIACVYQEPFEPHKQTYLDATNLLIAADLPVARVFDFDGESGVIVHEDFGDQVLRQVLETASDEQRENLICTAIQLIARIQAATPRAFELNSIAATLAFDFEKLGWELDFFTKHYFTSLRGETLSEIDSANLKTELDAVAHELHARPRVLTHRDFHAANLMLDKMGDLRIIDHQDARLGAASYDLVSLLLDRIDKPPDDDWIAEKQRFFLSERQKLDLPEIDFAEFAEEFRLQTIQRCLKAIGTFSFQTAVRGKTGYAQFIKPMFAVVLEAAGKLQRFPVLQSIIRERLK